jgi:hypothetical protein
LSQYLYNDKMQELIAEEVAKEEAALSMGSAESFDDYRYRCGKIAGLILASKISDDIKKLILGERS